MKYQPPSSALWFIALIITAIVNPYSAIDLAVLMTAGLIIFYKLFGDYAILALLAIRPILDYWRDIGIFSIQNYTININVAASILLIIWSGFFFWKNKEELKDWQRYLLLFFGFVTWAMLSIFWSKDSAGTLFEVFKTINLFALFLMTAILAKKDGRVFVRRFVLAFLAAGIAPIILASWQFFTGTGLDIDGISSRIYGTFAHPNILGTFALLALVVLTEQMDNCKITLYNWWTSKKGWLMTTLTLILLLTILFTYTRAVWVALAVVLLVIGLKIARRATLIISISVAVLYSLFFPVHRFLISEYNINLQNIPVIARLTSRNPDADSIRWRADVANKVAQLIRKEPVIGYGYGSFQKVWDDNKGIANLWDNTSEAHNDYLKLLFETGIVGLVMYLAILIYILLSAIRSKNIYYLSTIIAYILLSTSDNMLHHTPAVWWWFAAWGYWLGREKK